MEKKKGKQRQMGVEGESWQRHHNKMSRCHNTFFPDKKKKAGAMGGRGSWQSPMVESPRVAHTQSGTCGQFPLALVWDVGR